MAFSCDTTHPEPITAFVVMTTPETGDTIALCAPCLLEWAFGFLAQSEPGIELLTTKMQEMAAEAKAAEAKPKGRGRRAVPEAEGTGEATEAIAEATDTPATE